MTRGKSWFGASEKKFINFIRLTLVFTTLWPLSNHLHCFFLRIWINRLQRQRIKHPYPQKWKDVNKHYHISHHQMRNESNKLRNDDVKHFFFVTHPSSVQQMNEFVSEFNTACCANERICHVSFALLDMINGLRPGKWHFVSVKLTHSSRSIDFIKLLWYFVVLFFLAEDDSRTRVPIKIIINHGANMQSEFLAFIFLG